MCSKNSVSISRTKKLFLGGIKHFHQLLVIFLLQTFRFKYSKNHCPSLWVIYGKFILNLISHHDLINSMILAKCEEQNFYFLNRLIKYAIPYYASSLSWLLANKEPQNKFVPHQHRLNVLVDMIIKH